MAKDFSAAVREMMPLVENGDTTKGAVDEIRLPERAKAKPEIMRDKKIFEYGGYHFTPFRQFKAKEIDKPLQGDSRPRKKDMAYAMRNMVSDRSLGISAYDWKKTDASSYSHKAFYAASGGSAADIFKCVENGELYVPGANELFLYHEPPQKEQPASGGNKPKPKNEPPFLLGELSDAKAEAAAHNVAPRDNAQTKTRGSVDL